MCVMTEKVHLNTKSLKAVAGTSGLPVRAWRPSGGGH